MTHQSTANRDPAVAQQIGRDYARSLLLTKVGATEVAYTLLSRVPSVTLCRLSCRLDHGCLWGECGSSAI